MLSQEQKETLQGQIEQLEDIFYSIDTMNIDDEDTKDDLMYSLSRAIDCIKLIIKN